MGETTTTTTKGTTTTTTTEKPEDTTTTTTTEAVDTTTTTTESVKAEPQPEGSDASKNYPGGEASPMAERRGEIVADKEAPTKHLREQNADERLEQARQEGLRNAQSDRENTGAATDITPHSNDSDERSNS